MEASPISLYLQLEKGKNADIEVVSKAAIAFANAIRDAAYVIDPSLDIRVELVSGTPGSLSVNSIIRSIKESDLVSKKNLRAISIAAMLWFSGLTGQKLYDKVWDYVTGDTANIKLSQEDKQEIAALVVSALQKKVAAPHVQQVYSALHQDTAITGVGATMQAGKKPRDIVPREKFPERAGEIAVLEEGGKKRERREPETLTLISPVFKPTVRRWKFSGKDGEFGAVIKDYKFLEDFLAGKFAVPMAAGVLMDVLLRTVEERRNGVWQVIEKEILEVRRVRHSPMQQSLSLPMPGPKPKTSRPRNSSNKKGAN